MARCNSCEIMNINGVRCHETGCPDAWRDEVRECKECGSSFKPENRWQINCCHSCDVANSGAYCPCEECNADEVEEERWVVTANGSFVGRGLTDAEASNLCAQVRRHGKTAAMMVDRGSQHGV